MLRASCDTKIMDYLSMDDDIDLENELLQEQSLYELNYGEEEHDIDKHHVILDSKQLQQLQSNKTTSVAYEASSLIPDKVTSTFESSKSVNTQDKSRSIEDYNLFKDHARFYDTSFTLICSMK